VTAFEATASGRPGLRSLAGQLNGLEPPPSREAGAAYDEGVVLEAAIAETVRQLFSNTGPMGQRAMKSLATKLAKAAAEGVPADVVARSEAYGRSVAAHIASWS